MDLGVRPQHKMLWGEDIGPETDVDNPEVARDSRPESSQGEVADVSSESEEEEWKYVKGATKPEDKSQLNPNASEFVPGVDKFNPLEKDDLIASSPGVSLSAGNNLDDIDVPSETEFDHDISTKACDLESVKDIDDIDSVVELDLVKKMEKFTSDDEVKSDGVSLILTPQNVDPIEPDYEQKVETNPFASDMKPTTSPGNDKVDFVQDYFGKSELDFKPFESVTPHLASEKFNPHDLPESQMPNSVSAEISYQFNFINSHLENSENIRSEESEKERNQLEIKEPESPANSESCSNGQIEHEDHHNIIENFPVTKTSDVETDDLKTSHTSDIEHVFGVKSEKDADLIVSNFSSESMTVKQSIFEAEDCEGLVVHEEIVMGFEEGSHPVSHDVSGPEELGIITLKKSDCETGNKKPVITNFVEEVLSDIPQTEHENKESGVLSDLDDFRFDSSPILVTGNKNTVLKSYEDSDPHAIGDNQSEKINDDVNQLSEDIKHKDIQERQFIDKMDVEVNNLKLSEPFGSAEACEKAEVFVSNVEGIDYSSNPQIIESGLNVISNVEEISHGSPHEDINSHSDEHIEFAHTDVSSDVNSSNILDKVISSSTEKITSEVSPTEFADQITGGVSEDYSSQPSEHEIELADTLGPNAFSFSQPYEMEEVRGIPRMEFINLRRNDIMTTSMHESLEQDSSFEFISESAVRECVKEELIGSDSGPAQEEVHPETISETNSFDTVRLANGVDHIVMSNAMPFVNESVSKDNSTAIIEAESAIIESHEVPVSREPDLVFVESICPTVEVRSDEASPVNKENSGFELTPALSAVGITTALGAATVALAALPDQVEPETKKEDAKAIDSKTVKSSTAKVPLSKKNTSSTTTKPPVAKTTAKIAPTKTASTIAKSKVTAAPKTAANLIASKTKPVALVPKSPTTSVSKPAPKPATARATATTGTKAPSKAAATTKPLPSTTKTATRPVSAPSKVAPPLTKPAASSKTSTTVPRAPIPIKKLPASTAKPSLGSKTTPAPENKVSAKTVPLKSTLPPTTRPSVPKTTNTIGAKPPTRLGVSAAPASKLKLTSPTKPAPIKAKSPLSAIKRPTSATVKKTSTVLDKNAKNAVKSVPKGTAQNEIISSDNQLVEEAVTSTTTNGHHIENGNVTPLEEIPSQIM